MAVVSPFRALRPVPAAAARVSSVPYDVVSTEEARALAAGEPLSFLHVTRSEIDLPPGADPYGEAVYARARDNLAALERAAPLVREAEPALYFYRLQMGAHVQTGLAGCFSVDEYESGAIKKHEKTRRDKEDDRTRHVVTLRAQTGVVFLTYRASAAVDVVEAAVTRGAPLYDFTADDGVRHTVWRAEPAERDAAVRAFAAVPALYIADGHHRAASACRARAALRDAGGPAGERDRFIAVAFPDSQMQVLPYHRVVKDLGGRTPQAFAEELGRRFALAPGPAAPSRQGQVGVYLGGRWSTLTLPGPGASTPRGPGAADRLDVARLQVLVLGPLLGIGDPRTDKRIDFVGGIRGTGALERRVDAGQAAVAFSMFPVGVADLIAVSDVGEIMPPKSTWFEPKLRDGLLVHEI